MFHVGSGARLETVAWRHDGPHRLRAPHVHERANPDYDDLRAALADMVEEARGLLTDEVEFLKRRTDKKFDAILGRMEKRIQIFHEEVLRKLEEARLRLEELLRPAPEPEPPEAPKEYVDEQRRSLDLAHREAVSRFGGLFRRPR